MSFDPSDLTAPTSQASHRTDHNLYRPNVGIALFSQLGHIFLGHRINAQGPWQWQLPQGGIDEGETTLDAVYREMEEEIGLAAKSVRLLQLTDDWLYYDFPLQVKKRLRGPYIGQKQKWAAFRFLGSDSDIQLDRHAPAEFDSWRWSLTEDLPSLCVPFKRAIYENIMVRFAAYAQNPSEKPSRHTKA